MFSVSQTQLDLEAETRADLEVQHESAQSSEQRVRLQANLAASGTHGSALPGRPYSQRVLA